MRNIVKKLFGLLIGVGTIAAPAFAYADPPEASLKVEPGVAFPLTAPQQDRFNVGGAVSGKVLIGILPFLDAGPSASYMALPSAVSGINAGTAGGFGGSVRVKRPRDESNKGTGMSAVSPWVDTDLQYIRTGALDRFGVAVGAGAQIPTSDSRTLWVGPFVRYQDVFQDDRPGMDGRDARTLITGLSFEVSPHAARKVQPAPVPETPKPVPPVVSDRDHDGTPDATDRCPDVPGPKDNFGCPLATPPETVKVEIQERVHFDINSDVIRKDETAGLDKAAEALLKHTDLMVKVEGHASSDGPVEFNNKLAQKRADAVKKYLVSKGFPADHLTSVGFGSRVPLESNKTLNGRKANRRAEFVVTFTVVKDSK